MALGDNRFSRVETDFNALLSLNGINVTISRTIQSEITERDIYGTPIGYTPETLTATILITDQYLDETTVLAGGKPKEILKIIANAGTFIENDEIPYNSHNYQITSVENVPLGGNNTLEMCIATREVEV